MFSGGDRDIRSVTGGAGTPLEDLPASVQPDAMRDEPINLRRDVLGYAEALTFGHGHVSTEGRSPWLLLKLFTNLGRAITTSVVTDIPAADHAVSAAGAVRTDLPGWARTPQSIRETLLYILRTYLDSDIENIAASESFISGKFELPDGSVRTGNAILNTISKVESGKVSVKEAIDIIGNGGAARIIREKYLFQWDETEEDLSRALRYITSFVFEGDSSKLYEEKFKTLEFVFPDGTVIVGEKIIELARRLTSWGDATDDQILKKLYLIGEKRRTRKVASPDWASTPQRISETLSYIVDKYLGGDATRVQGEKFRNMPFVLPGGVEVRGERMLRNIAKLEMPKNSGAEATAKMGWAELSRTAIEKYLFRMSETPEALVRAIRCVVKNDLKDDSGRLFEKEFRSTSFFLPDGTTITGERIIELGRRLFSWTELSDESVLKGLYEKTLISFREGDAASLISVVRYIVKQYLNDEFENVRTTKSFKDAHFMLPDGSEVTGARILGAVARMEYSLGPRSQIKRLMTRGETGQIIREKYSFQMDATPEDLVRAVRYIVKYELGGDETGFLSPDFRGTEIHLPGGNAITGETIIDVGRKMFSWPDMKDGEVLQRLYEKAGTVLQDDAASLTHVVRYVVAQYFDNDWERITTGPLFANKYFILPDGSKVKGSLILYAADRVERPSVDTESRHITSDGALLTQEKYSFRLDATPEDLVRGIRYIVKYELGGDEKRLFLPEFKGTEMRMPDGTMITGEKIIDVGRQLFSLHGMNDEEVLRLLHVKTLVALQKNKVSLTHLIRYIVDQYLDGDPDKILSGGAFDGKMFVLPDGSKVTGGRILNAIATIEGLADDPDKYKRSDITSIILQRYVSWWDETPVGLVCAVRHILKYEMNGDSARLSGDQFKLSVFVLPDGTSITGGKIVEFGKRLFSWEDVDDDAVIKRLFDKTLVVPRDDEVSVRRIVQYIFEEYLGGDPNRVNTKILANTFVLPDGTRIGGRRLLGMVAKLEYPYKLVNDVMVETGAAELMCIIREKYLGITPPDLSKVKDLPGAGMLADSPFDLLQLARALLPDGERISPQDFIRNYRTLNLGEVGKATGRSGEPPSERFIGEVLDSREMQERLDETRIAIVSDLHINILYQQFAASHGKIFPYLRSVSARNTDPVRGDIYKRAIEHFSGIEGIAVSNIRSKLFMYQRSSVEFLLPRKGAMLALEPGMGKTLVVLAAAESVGAKRILIVTPSRGTSTWTEEIERHLRTTPEYLVLGASDKMKLRNRSSDPEFIRRLRTAKYLIVNYEALRELAKEPGSNPLLAYLRDEAGLDTIVVDESQNIDSPKKEVQQADAVRQLRNIPRRWLVSASPYQSKPANLFTSLGFIAPDKFVSEGNASDGGMTFATFKQNYIDGGDASLENLNALLRQYMYRRRKDQVLKIVDPAKPMSSQRGRLPRMNPVPYADEGAYPLNDEQANMMRHMITDFTAWAAKYNEWAAVHNAALPETGAGSEEVRPIIELEKINSLSKLGWLRRIMADPEIAGATRISPLYAALDPIVEKYRDERKKIILFANHTRVVSNLMERYARHGIVRIDGTVSREEQDEARHRFNSDPDTSMVAAQLKSGGVGINLPAGDVVIFVEQPIAYVSRYQAEHRANRADPDFTKAEVQVIDIVGQYPPGFVERLDEDIRRFFEVGTIAEIEHSTVSRRGLEFKLVMDGYTSRSSFMANMRGDVLSALGWKQTEDAAVEDEDDDDENNGGSGSSTPSVPPAPSTPPAPETPPSPSAPPSSDASAAPTETVITGMSSSEETVSTYSSQYTVTAGTMVPQWTTMSTMSTMTPMLSAATYMAPAMRMPVMPMMPLAMAL